MFRGCYTALITPMLKNSKMDWDGLKTLIEFQTHQNVSGIVATGTTGESATLTWKEHNRVIEKAFEYNAEGSIIIAGTGSNCTREAMAGTKHAFDIGIRAVLLVDPYYNCPSSIEIRREYIAPIAKRFPEVQVIPYVIPGRTGTQLLPQDLALLHAQFANVSCVKEATGDFENMKLIRRFCGGNFDILSGDDDKTFIMMTDCNVKASGVVSVVSNIAPAAVQRMTSLTLEGKIEEAKALCDKLTPLFRVVTVKTVEETPFGNVAVKARNPLPFKTLMNVMGMPAGPLRSPLGKMTPKGLEIVLEAARETHQKNPDILKPVEDFFDVDLSERLYNKRYWKGLVYD